MLQGVSVSLCASHPAFSSAHQTKTQTLYFLSFIILHSLFICSLFLSHSSVNALSKKTTPSHLTSPTTCTCNRVRCHTSHSIFSCSRSNFPCSRNTCSPYRSTFPCNRARYRTSRGTFPCIQSTFPRSRSTCSTSLTIFPRSRTRRSSSRTPFTCNSGSDL